MRMSRLFVLSMLLGSALVACGDDGGKTTPDAPKQIDAPTVDAPPALTGGLGKLCGTGMPMCPTGTTCFSNAAGKGFCSLVCHTAATFMTNAQNMFNFPNLDADAATCAAQRGAAEGVPECFLQTNLAPALTGTPPNTAPNTTYTYDAICDLDCTSSACPTGFTCSAQKVCLPT